MRIPPSLLLSLLLLAGCTTVGRLTKRDRSTAAKDDQPELMEDENGMLNENTPVPIDTSYASAPPPGEAAANAPGAQARVPGTVVENQRTTPVASDGYASSPAAPRPYGPAQSPSVGTDQQPATIASPGELVRPNTTLVNTPEHYEHVTAVPQMAIKAPFASALTGLWTNVDDPDEIVEFTPTHYTTFYRDNRLLREPMTVHPRCPGDCTGGVPSDRACLTVAGPAGIDCFAIVRLSALEMELLLLGVSDTTVTYRRK